MSKNLAKLRLAKTHDKCGSSKPRLTVVCLHGIASDSTTFEQALKYWEGEESLQDVRFVTFDLLGAGKSLSDESLNYDYREQLEALHNALEDLKLDTPLVIVGHSMGTLIATRYADTYKKAVTKLILISPPVYTERDFSDPLFLEGMKMFRDAVRLKSRDIFKSKQFEASMEHIVSDQRNYKVLAGLQTPAVLIYGFKDKIISPYNIPKVISDNPNLVAIKTDGLHGVSIDKYRKVPKLLREVLNETT